MALAATGDAKSRRPGRMLTIVVNQIARKGVDVHRDIWPKKPQSGKPWSLEKAKSVREHAWMAVCTTKKAVMHTNVYAPG